VPGADILPVVRTAEIEPTPPPIRGDLTQLFPCWALRFAHYE
jgi:hypothetical protein